MKYFLKGMKDRRFWLMLIGVPLLASLIFWDLLIGLFGHWTILLTLLGGGIFVFFKVCRDTKRMRTDRLEAARQKDFESRRLEELRRRVKADPEHQTFCFRCRHYDREKTSCNLEIFNHSARRVRLDTPFLYCLYYEPAGEDSP